MKLLILATALMGLTGIIPAIAGQTCVIRNGYMVCGDSYNDYSQNCIRQGSSFVCN